MIVKNPNSYGIPQGSPISALLANVYMLDVDKKVYEIVAAQNGMYMRYSDDFIIILPIRDAEGVSSCRSQEDPFLYKGANFLLIRWKVFLLYIVNA